MVILYFQTSITLVDTNWLSVHSPNRLSVWLLVTWTLFPHSSFRPHIVSFHKNNDATTKFVFFHFMFHWPQILQIHSGQQRLNCNLIFNYKTIICLIHFYDKKFCIFFFGSTVISHFGSCVIVLPERRL